MLKLTFFLVIWSHAIELDAYAQEAAKSSTLHRKNREIRLQMSESAGSVSAGESHDGVISQLYVVAPPGWTYQIDRTPGSFVDCGEGSELRQADENGQDSPKLSCGVTLTETLVIPAASQSARLIIHF